MLSRRLQTLLNVRDRATFLRHYFAGIPMLPNLQRECNASSRYRSYCMKRTLNPFRGIQRRLAITEKEYTTITTCANSSADGNINPESMSENAYARSVIANSAKAPKTIGAPLETIEIVSDADVEQILSRDWKNASADEIVAAFKTLSCHAKVNDLTLSQDKHEEILRALCEKLHELDDKMLCQVFQCLVLWKFIMSEKCLAYTDLWMALDKACVQRLHSWSVEEALVFADYWYQLRLTRKAKYVWQATKQLGGKPNKLNSINFLHFMFLVNMGRKPPFNMYEIEYRFDAILDEFTVNELGVIAMAFFKTETRLRDQKIMTRMHKKLLNEWKDVEDISLTAIMKMSRYNPSLKEIQVIFQILNCLKSRVSKLSIPCLVHITHAAAYMQCYDAELIEMVVERFEKDIDTARIKDLERICWVLSIFDYGPETPFYHRIVENLRDEKRNDEMTRFPMVVPTTLTHLSHAGVFPIDLIQKSLSMDFLDRLYNHNVFKLGWDLFALENNVKIEVPEYDGPFLKDSIREFLTKKYTGSVERTKEKAHFADKFVLEVAHMCKLVLESDTAIHIDQLLPHFMKPDIAVCLDEENNSVAPEPILSKLPVGRIKYAPNQVGNLKWIAIILATQNQLLKGTEKHIGLLTCKIRQLKKIGYTPIVITYVKWRDLPSLEAKQNYLRSLLALKPVADRKVSAGSL